MNDKETPAVTAAPDEKKLKKSAKSELLEWIKDLLIAAIIVLVVLQFVMPTIVREHSMENTLKENDYVIVSRKSYTWLGRDIQRGDIIVFKSNLKTTLGTEKLLVKRIIGLPGDKVSISDGKVFINGEALEENYTKDGYTGGAMDEITVPEGYVFVMGDNRQSSTDSRSELVGSVPIEKIKGKVIFRLFPLKKAGKM